MTASEAVAREGDIMQMHYVEPSEGLKKPAQEPGTIRNRRLRRRVQDIEKLPRRDQEALLRTIEAFLAKAG